uniref:Uncharacterized protein n=1 Tax=Oryza punctata TaxID=4537 RepID=A0A0E0K248_ORYPU
MPLVFKISEICFFVVIVGYCSRRKANALCPKTSQCFVAISSFARRMFRKISSAAANSKFDLNVLGKREIKFGET